MDRDVVEKYAEQDQPLIVRASRSSLRCAPSGYFKAENQIREACSGTVG
jgi:hypothetical protein